ncbi:hypothetical protein NHX12_027418 [Muraenolepis orangiensis]|uniref:Uncharacterized protein n=1 Tax=Muraenolepis orangiensis TaxID=630683 RepID=A0A9Q0EGL0_9TELE|nr:hypothetical protein NHX12_027418 [Muraenolepis orangiensis]
MERQGKDGEAGEGWRGRGWMERQEKDVDHTDSTPLRMRLPVQRFWLAVVGSLPEGPYPDLLINDKEVEVFFPSPLHEGVKSLLFFCAEADLRYEPQSVGASETPSTILSDLQTEDA